MSEKEKCRPIGMICDYDEGIENFYKTPLYLDENLNYFALDPDGEMFKINEKFLWAMFSCPLEEQKLLFRFDKENNLYTAHYQAFYGPKRRYEIIGVGTDIEMAYAEMLVYFAVLYQNFDEESFANYLNKEMKDEQLGTFSFKPPPSEDLPKEWFEANLSR